MADDPFSPSLPASQGEVLPRPIRLLPRPHSYFDELNEDIQRFIDVYILCSDAQQAARLTGIPASSANGILKIYANALRERVSQCEYKPSTKEERLQSLESLMRFSSDDKVRLAATTYLIDFYEDKPTLDGTPGKPTKLTEIMQRHHEAEKKNNGVPKLNGK